MVLMGKLIKAKYVFSAVILCLSLNLSADDLSVFVSTADRLSKDIRLTVFDSWKKRTTKEDNTNYQFEDYEFRSNGYSFTLRYVGNGFADFDKAARLEDGDSFKAFSQQIWFGKNKIVEREYTKLSKTAQDRFNALSRQYGEMVDLPTEQQNPIKMAEVLKNLKEINMLQIDSRTLADGSIKFEMRNQAHRTSKDPARCLVVNGKRIDGMNPIANLLGFSGMQKQLESAWLEDGRGGVRSLEDLQAIGLIDSIQLKCARISMFGIPFDGWLPRAAPLDSPTLGVGTLLPGFQGGPKSVTVGNYFFGPEIAPLASYHATSHKLLPTFMLPESDKTPLNSANEYNRVNPSNLKIPIRMDEKILPFAGMDDENRVFVFSWVAVRGNNGLFMLCQYSDENRPRIAYLDASGVVFRIKDGFVGAGVKSENIKVNNKIIFEQMFWGQNSMVTIGEKEKAWLKIVPRFEYKEIIQIGPYRHDPARLQHTGSEWINSTTLLAMPRALW